MQKSFESTFGSLKNKCGSKGSEAFITRFDQYKDELEQRERELS